MFIEFTVVQNVPTTDDLVSTASTPSVKTVLITAEGDSELVMKVIENIKWSLGGEIA